MERISTWYDQRKTAIVNNYWIVVAATTLAFSSITPVYAAATDIFSGLEIVLKSVYVKISALVTLIAVVALVIALLFRMSKHQKTVEEANNWIKRILWSWVGINSLGWIIAYLSSVFTGAYVA